MPASKSESKSNRRRMTQAERRAVTRAKITTAALDLLGRVGYAQMTFADVAAAAGVSRGAMLHYFPQKTDLALGAIEEGETIVLRQLRDSVRAAQGQPDRDARILDGLYEVFAGPEFQAFLAFQVHARTDHELNLRLHEIVEHATEQMGLISAEGWGE